MCDLWKGVKPYRHNNDFFGIGFRNKRRKKGQRVRKRQYLRDLRKVGFDTTEIWSLDSAILKWLAEKVGGIFITCGDPDNWDMIELGGYKWNNLDRFSFERCQKAYQERTKCIKEHLRNYLDNAPEEFINFIVPRLRYFAKNTDGYPVLYKEIKTLEDWQDIVNDMADKFEQKTYSENFIKYFFNLWT